MPIIQYVPFINSMLLIAGSIIAWYAYSVSIRHFRSERSKYIQEFVIQHNNRCAGDIHRQIATTVFLGINYKKLNYKIKEISKNDHFELYWATRLMHLNHINIINSGWIASGECEIKFANMFPKWQNLTNRLACDLSRSKNNNSGKPSWYTEACTDLWPIEESFVYSEKFINYMMNSSKPYSNIREPRTP